jgi:hypothetical protein
MTTSGPKPTTYQHVAQCHNQLCHNQLCLNQLFHDIPPFLCLKLKVPEISNNMFVTLQLGCASYDDICKKNPQLCTTKLLLIYKSCQFSIRQKGLEDLCSRNMLACQHILQPLLMYLFKYVKQLVMFLLLICNFEMFQLKFPLIHCR